LFSVLRSPQRHWSRLPRVLGLLGAVGASAVACRSKDQPGKADTPSIERTTTDGAAPNAGWTPADTDDFGVPLPSDASFARRVVSLNPAATEVLFAIGAQSRLVGRSAWDEFPAEAAAIPSVGNGIRPNVEAVLQQRPTLVILYATAENRAAAQAFARAGVRTMALRVDRIAQFMSFTTRLGVAVGEGRRAQAMVDSVQQTLDRVRAVTGSATRHTVVWPVWQQPVLAVGGGSYLDELIEVAGGRNVFHDRAAPSPPVSIEEIARRDPDMIVATERTASELKAKPQWNSVRAVREQHWLHHNPVLTGRPSVVLGSAAVSLARLLHPELSAALPPLPASPSVGGRTP
jgi:ABC-type Fe3+-hydroxamate transport system substrate-binding protein